LFICTSTRYTNTELLDRISSVANKRPSNSSVVHTRAPPASKLAAACRGTVAAYKSAVASDDSTDVSANCCTAVRRVGNTRYKSRLSRSSDSSSYCVVAASSRSIRAPCFIRGDNALLFEP